MSESFTGRTAMPDPDADKARDLRRIKAFASLGLVAALVLLIAAKSFEPRYPWLAYVAAFAEAAAIGGLADWYAVVALFRHPLNIPIPHTAIVPKNQGRIAEKLGVFIERHFLRREAIEAKLKGIDFAAFIAEWLADRGRSANLSRFGLRLLPEAFQAAESSGLKAYLTGRAMAQAAAIDVAPLAAGAMRAFLTPERRQSLLDALLRAMGETLEDETALAALRDKIRDELPTLLRLYRADGFILRRLVGTAGRFLNEVGENPNHPFRAEFDRLVTNLLGRLESDPDYAQRLQGWKNDVLHRPELADIGRRLWQSTQRFLEISAEGKNDSLDRLLTRAFVDIGDQLRTDQDMRREINAGLVGVLQHFIEERKGGVSGFIAEQVKSWDFTQLVHLIEVNIGRDLQYIRFNGMIVGGLAGLALHIGKAAFGLR